VFNRGVEKRKIFLDEQDHNMLLYYLFIYLAPMETVLEKYPRLPLRLYSSNLSKEVKMLSYCLMPNHFHFLIKQHSKDGVSKLLKQITNAYTLYFNNKYERVGGLVQGRFKAVGIDKDELLIHVMRYIHLNPVVAGIVKNPKDYKWSSHMAYLGGNDHVCDTETILSYFENIDSFERFILDHIEYASLLEKIKHLTLDG
jgi:putative transposase